jgi:hypothetical protein
MDGLGWTGGRGDVAAQPELSCLIRAWSALAAGGLPPRRAEIDPRGIEPALPDAFIAERIAPGLARFRLAGHRLAELMGMELRGLPLSALIEPDHRDAFRRLVAAVFERPAILSATVAAGWGLGRPALAGALVLLPLRDEAGAVTRLLGGLAAQGSPGRAPRRFRLDDPRLEALPLAAAAGAVRGAAVAAAPPAAPPTRPAPRDAGRPPLRLVWSAP